jgi:hypothetical protein
MGLVGWVIGVVELMGFLSFGVAVLEHCELWDYTKWNSVSDCRAFWELIGFYIFKMGLLSFNVSLTEYK